MRTKLLRKLKKLGTMALAIALAVTMIANSGNISALAFEETGALVEEGTPEEKDAPEGDAAPGGEEILSSMLFLDEEQEVIADENAVVTFQYRLEVNAATTSSTVELALGDGILANAPTVTSPVENKTHQFTFAGWFYDATFQNPVGAEDVLTTTTDFQIYAKYDMVTIAYFYVLNPGLTLPSEAGQYHSNQYTNGVKVYGALPLSYNPTVIYNGAHIYNPVNIAAGLDSTVFNAGATLPDATQFKTIAGRGVALPAGSVLTWYVVKTSSGRYHVDGYVSGQAFSVTFNYYNDFLITDSNKISSTQTTLLGQSALPPSLEAVQRTGYTFEGWDSDAWTSVSGNTNVNAVYKIKSYPVSYVNDLNTSLVSVSAEHGTIAGLSKPATPSSEQPAIVDGVKKNYTFKTWAVVNEDLTLSEVDVDTYEITAPVTFKAVYTSEDLAYAITYDLVGGALEDGMTNPELVEVGAEPITLHNPTKFGYTFNGWLQGEGSTPVNPFVIQNLEGPLYLVADYSANVHQVTYHFKNRSIDKRKAVAATTTAPIAFGSTVLFTAPDMTTQGTFETLTREYVFEGWFYDEAFTMPVLEEDLLNVDQNIDVYAKYKEQTIAYFYVLNPGLSMPDEAGQYASNRYSNGVKLYGVLPLTYNGGYVLNTEDLAAGLDASVFTEGTVFPTASQFRTTQGRGTNLPENAQITWYVVKTAGGTYHIDGFVNNQEYPLTINYVYEGEEAEQAAATYTAMVGFEDAFAVPSPAIEFYTPSLSTVSGVMTGDDTNPLTGLTYTVVYSRTTVPFTVNYYSGSLTGIWLNAVTLNVNLDVLSAPDAQAQLAAMAGVNTYRPGNMSSGLIRQFDTENRVMGIVYEPIEVVKSYTVTFVDQFGNTLKTETVTEGNDATAPATLAIAGFTFANWDKAFTDITADTVVTALYTAIPAPGPAPAPTPTPTPAPAEEVVVIEEEETPLVETPEEVVEETPAPEEEVVEIEEEETPLAVLEGDCIIHWIILLITAMYAVYGVLRAVARNKKIRQLQGANDQVNA